MRACWAPTFELFKRRRKLLTNAEIQDLILKDAIKNWRPKGVQPASYDMAIGTIFRGGEIINGQHTKAKDPVIIQPGEVVSMLTLEELDLPDNVAGTAYAMNAQSSEGLLVLNPGHVDPGYKGALSVVALNLRKVPLALQLGDNIFTIVFNRLAQPSTPTYASIYGQGPMRPDRERSVNQKVVEKSIESLDKLLSISHKDINELIRDHWMSRVVFGCTLIGAIFAIIAAVFAVIPVLQNNGAQTNSNSMNASLPILSTQTSAHSSKSGLQQDNGNADERSVAPSASAAKKE
jgi:deoxycytidine triphosphate deaminase